MHHTTQGFSLTEVLISLLLVTSSALALFKQEWQITQSFYQLYAQMDSLLQNDNLSEKQSFYETR